MRNDIEVGGTDDGIIAKVGTDTLDTTAQDLSGAINEHEEDISQLNSSLTITSVSVNTEKIKGTCYRWGKICMLSILNGADTATPADTTLATLPQGYRPIEQAEFVDSYGKIRMRITDTGRIVNVERAAGFIRGTCVFITQ
jgi:hypothetical protein